MSEEIKKVVRKGKVAVLYSPGYGAGWSTWGSTDQSIFSPEIVELVEQGRHDEITEELVNRLFNTNYFCIAGAKQLRVKWLPVGTVFKIDEYDGAESITTNQDSDFKVA